MVSAQRTRLRILAALVAGSAALGCGSDDGDNGNTNTGNDGGNGSGMDGGGVANDNLKISFSPMYSAFIPNSTAHEFKLPVKVEGASGELTVTTEPAGFVDYAPNADGVMLTMKRAGDAMVIIKDSKGNGGKAELHVTAGTDEDWDRGKERYSNGVEAFNIEAGLAMLPEGGFDSGITFLPDGAIVLPEGGLPSFPRSAASLRNPDSACSSCHTSAGGMPRLLPDGGMLQLDVEHTPQQTGGYNDDQLKTIFSDGMKPAGSPFRVLSKLPFIGVIPGGPEGVYRSIHRWTMTDEQKSSIIIYLRSLTPKAQGDVDFGGLLPPRGAGGFPGGGAAGGGTGGGTAGGGTAGGSTGG
jgi:hypothetical protein